MKFTNTGKEQHSESKIIPPQTQMQMQTYQNLLRF